ncbi:MAG: hypothetical protein JJU11_15960 [Candidatus Sumerlaeia bacterium]|nr:hypothetical protein [Candidatus Sumerlaeia bacterium]
MFDNPDPARRIWWAGSVAGCMVALLLGCAPPREGDPISGLRVIGEAGRQPGQFSRPRAVGITSNLDLVVIDRTGRIQVFDLPSGEFTRQWWLDEFENGTPTGLSIDPTDDTLWIADTHYHRILQYNVEGDLLFSFGEEGIDRGQFLFPTDVGVSPDGKILWVTDYGRRNRVMKFTREGEYIMEFGEEEWHNADLNRPQSIVTSPDGLELFVIDAGNSRVNVYNHDGELLRRIAMEGDEPGRLKYPMDISLGPDGLLYIAEYENCRISRFSFDGEFHGSWGKPGRFEGSLFAPWGVAIGPGGQMVIADTNNQRLQVIDRPDRHFSVVSSTSIAMAEEEE